MPSRRHLFRFENCSAYYHCVSRVVDRNFVFDVHERDVFRRILRQVEAFSGVRVLTWTILSNHFHVLLEVPVRPTEQLSDHDILERCRALYSKKGMTMIGHEFEEARRNGDVALERVREKFLRRMWDLSEFMKTLKQKFSRWFNRTHDRVGTLWESRFKSVIVEGNWNCLLKVAAYIDLNAVRAKLADDPADYRWCGYSEAVAGDTAARRGLSVALSSLKNGATWRDVAPQYRKILFGIGEGTSTGAGLSPASVAEVWKAGGKLTISQVLRCQLRHFSDGLAIGSKAFVEQLFKFRPDFFGSRRKSGARNITRDDWGDLRCARALRVQPIRLPSANSERPGNPPP